MEYASTANMKNSNIAVRFLQMTIDNVYSAGPENMYPRNTRVKTNIKHARFKFVYTLNSAGVENIHPQTYPSNYYIQNGK